MTDDTDEQLRANIRDVIERAGLLRNAKNEKRAQLAKLPELEALRMLQPIMQRFVEEQTDTIKVDPRSLDQTMKTILQRDFRVDVAYGGDYYQLTLPLGE